jgi:hypothetical protein
MDNSCSFFCTEIQRMTLRQLGSFSDVRGFYVTPTCISLSNSRLVTFRALHKENSGCTAPTLGRHISTFRGYQILFSIRNPYINRFTNHFYIHSQPSYPQKVVLHSITARFCLRPYHFAI